MATEKRDTSRVNGVLLAGSTMDALREKTTTSPYRELWKRIVARWREMVALDAATDEYLTYGGLGWHSVTPGVVEAGVIWRLCDDRAGLEHVERCIGYLSEVYEGSPGYVASLPQHHTRPVISHGETAIAADLCRADLSAESRATLNRLMREKIIPCSNHDMVLTGYSGGGNIPVYQSISAGIAALLWGEESGYEGWDGLVDRTREVCLKYVHHGCDAEGYGYEGSGYVQDVQAAIVLFAELLKRSGREDLFTLEPAIQRFGTASLSLLFPDRSALMNVGDVGIASPPGMSWMLILAEEYQDSRLRGFWHELEGPPEFSRDPASVPSTDRTLIQLRHLLLAFLYWDAEAPATPVAATDLPTANYSPGTEVANFRTSWGTDAVYVNLLGAGRSHTSLVHCHADCGHFSVFAYGEYLAIDTGRYNGYADQHSVVLVDGEEESSEDQWGTVYTASRLRNFHRHDLLDYAMADAAQMKNCLWADRHLMFVRLSDDDCYIVVIDNINRDNAKHSYWWQLQAHPECSVETTGERTAVVEGSKARLDLTFAIPGPEVFPDDPHTLDLRVDEKWWCWPYGRGADNRAYGEGLDSTSIHRPRLIAEQTGLNGQIAAIIVPRRKGQPSLSVRQIPHPHVMQIEVSGEGFEDTVLCALDHKYIEMPGLSGRTELALVRRGTAGDLQGVWTVDGSPLRIG